MKLGLGKFQCNLIFLFSPLCHLVLFFLAAEMHLGVCHVIADCQKIGENASCRWDERECIDIKPEYPAVKCEVDGTNLFSITKPFYCRIHLCR